MQKLIYQSSPSRKNDFKKIMTSYNKHMTACSYCGFMYKNISFCSSHGFNSDGSFNGELIFPCCELCHIITTYSQKFIHSVIVCESNLSQLKINQLTTKFIIDNKKNPSIFDIDKNAIKTTINATKFYSNVEKFSDKMRLFFIDLNLSKIVLNVRNEKNEHVQHITYNMFNDDPIFENDEINKLILDRQIDTYKMLIKWQIKTNTMFNEYIQLQKKLFMF